jgi:anti-sigma factor RsiW
MTEARSVSEADLHAFVDGLLDPEEQARVERYIADHPEAAELVADWQQQNDDLRTTFAGYELSKGSDIHLVAGTSARSARQPLRQYAITIAASIAIFTLGAVVGRLLPPIFEQPEIQLASMDVLPREARNAFLVYASDVRHPVEVFADQEAHLASWLGKRLSVDKLKVPQLQSLGFRLVGGRLLPVAGEPGAMFMYEDAAGTRVTVMVGRNRQNRATSFRFASADDVETFYWIDGDLGYAVSGEISRDALQKIAEECYRQFPA